MKIALVAHGYPPELTGGTELAVRGLAHALARRGHDVVVVAGTIEPGGAGRALETAEMLTRDAQDGAVRVRRIHRADLYFDHWHKTSSPAVQRALRSVWKEERPDVVHVHHWVRLTREIVHTCALEGVPALVSLHDFWTSCPITFRVRPDTRAACDAEVGAHPCVACAGRVPPKTPWVPREAQYMALHERQRDIARELRLARGVFAPSRAHAESCRRFLGDAARDLEIQVVEPPPYAPREPDRDETAHASPSERDAGGTPRGSGRLVLASWGQISLLKGTDLLVDAVAEIARDLPVELHLAGACGDAAFEADLRARCAGLPVVFHGAFERAGLARHPVASAHTFVSASRARESWGSVLDEARALRLPSVLPRAGAFAERAHEDDGSLLYAPGDAHALAGVLRRLWDEPDLLRRLRESLPPVALRAADDGDRWVDEWIAHYERARRAGAPEVPSVASDWYSERMREFALEQWDRALAATPRGELGFDSV